LEHALLLSQAPEGFERAKTTATNDRNFASVYH